MLGIPRSKLLLMEANHPLSDQGDSFGAFSQNHGECCNI